MVLDGRLAFNVVYRVIVWLVLAVMPSLQRKQAVVDGRGYSGVVSVIDLLV